MTSGVPDEIDKVQSTFWREWKQKLDEQKSIADKTRLLEQLIPGVETTRFLSGDSKYIKSAVISLIESVKLEKKRILKDLLKLADTYGLNRTEVWWFAWMFGCHILLLNLVNSLENLTKLYKYFRKSLRAECLLRSSSAFFCESRLYDL